MEMWWKPSSCLLVVLLGIVLVTSLLCVESLNAEQKIAHIEKPCKSLFNCK
ncbi:uncharacterized protein G2W53_005963 [Senna tora]|uniref:Uncharacterized protein n=1 Tax=Senna tora TaxID=362788 RepID=A0A835CDF4_9FABA|nr:uncharacterized protein G2W53_005963 [Senna tora]